MAIMVITDPYLTLNASTALTTYLRKAVLNAEVEEQDATASGQGGWRQFVGGLKTGTLELEFNNDYTDGTVDSVLWALLGTTVAFKLRPDDAAIGVNNPSYEGNVVVGGLTPITGTVGDLATTGATWNVTGAVSRVTA